MSREGPMVGVDIGGTTVDAVIADPVRGIAGRARHPTDVTTADAVLDSAAAAIRDALAQADVAVGRLTGIGVGIPGQVDADEGVVHLATNLNITDGGLPVRSVMEREFGIPVMVENDVRAAAVAATALFAEELPRLGDLVYVSIGTGISAGAVLHGRLHRGRDGLAGEIGHVVVEPDGPPCRCGQRGCLEAVASGPAISRMWETDGSRQPGEVFRAARDGDLRAREVATAAIDHLVRAIHWLAAAYGPDLVVLGGGVGSDEALLDAIRGRLAHIAGRSTLASRMVPPDRVVAIPRGYPAGAVGAATLARRLLAGDGRTGGPQETDRVRAAGAPHGKEGGGA